MRKQEQLWAANGACIMFALNPSIEAHHEDFFIRDQRPGIPGRFGVFSSGG